MEINNEKKSPCLNRRQGDNACYNNFGYVMLMMMKIMLSEMSCVMSFGTFGASYEVVG